MIFVVDASAAIAFLEDEPGADVVEALLLDQSNSAIIHVVNLAEVYYHFLRSLYDTSAEQSVRDLFAAGVTLSRNLSDELWRDVARLKARHHLSLADCFCLAQALVAGATALTADHHEMDALVALNLVKIQFIR